MDFWWFALGNHVIILASLTTREQSMAIVDLIEARLKELVGEMPLKIVYPAIESHEWHVVTGCDRNNTRWSYHIVGSWPSLFLKFFSVPWIWCFNVLMFDVIKLFDGNYKFV